MNRLSRLAVVAVLALSFPVTRAAAAPDPIPFCLPDLDGHCRYCEIRFAPLGIYCLAG